MIREKFLKVIVQRHFICFVSLCAIILFLPLFAEARRGVPITNEEVEERVVDYVHKRKSFQAILYCYEDVPGRVFVRAGELAFESLTDELKRKRKKRRKTGKPLKKVLAKLRSLVVQSSDVCLHPGATPTPSNAPPPSSNGYFEDNGDVTTLGKTTFLIPAQLSANIWTGRDVFNSKCSGCHEERTNRDFQNLRTNTARSPMFYDEATLPNADLAHLTAYLNRFRDPAAE